MIQNLLHTKLKGTKRKNIEGPKEKTQMKYE